jgi:uncharacterized ferredoxin-like protein
VKLSYVVSKGVQSLEVEKLVFMKSEDSETEGVLAVAKMMTVAARTAPKARGVDRVVTAIVDGEEKERIAQAMERKADQRRNPLPGFRRDAENLRRSTAVVLIGVKGTVPKRPENPLNCGGCGYPSCAEFMKAPKKKGEDFVGPLCIFEVMDLGIALGSAVKIASDMNVDNRMMFTIGAAAKALGMLDADAIIGIPLSCTGKNIYFDRG